MRLTLGILGGLALSLSAGFASAYTCEDQIKNITGLDDTAKQTMIVQCNQQKLDATKTVAGVVDGISPQRISEWGAVSKDFAVALGIAAKELGIAANEFLDTDAGLLTAGLIVWHVAGASIAGILIGVPMLVAFWWLLIGYMKRSKINEITYADNGARHWWGPKIIKNITYHESSEDRNWMLIVCMVALAIGTWAICGAIIF